MFNRDDMSEFSSEKLIDDIASGIKKFYEDQQDDSNITAGESMLSTVAIDAANTGSTEDSRAARNLLQSIADSQAQMLAIAKAFDQQTAEMRQWQREDDMMNNAGQQSSNKGYDYGLEAQRIRAQRQANPDKPMTAYEDTSNLRGILFNLGMDTVARNISNAARTLDRLVDAGNAFSNNLGNNGKMDRAWEVASNWLHGIKQEDVDKARLTNASEQAVSLVDKVMNQDDSEKQKQTKDNVFLDKSQWPDFFQNAANKTISDSEAIANSIKGAFKKVAANKIVIQADTVSLNFEDTDLFGALTQGNDSSSESAAETVSNIADRVMNSGSDIATTPKAGNGSKSGSAVGQVVSEVAGNVAGKVVENVAGKAIGGVAESTVANTAAATGWDAALGAGTKAAGSAAAGAATGAAASAAGGGMLKAGLGLASKAFGLSNPVGWIATIAGLAKTGIDLGWQANEAGALQGDGLDEGFRQMGQNALQDIKKSIGLSSVSGKDLQQMRQRSSQTGFDIESEAGQNSIDVQKYAQNMGMDAGTAAQLSQSLLMMGGSAQEAKDQLDDLKTASKKLGVDFKTLSTNAAKYSSLFATSDAAEIGTKAAATDQNTNRVMGLNATNGTEGFQGTSMQQYATALVARQQGRSLFWAYSKDSTNRFNADEKAEDGVDDVLATALRVSPLANMYRNPNLTDDDRTALAYNTAGSLGLNLSGGDIKKFEDVLSGKTKLEDSGIDFKKASESNDKKSSGGKEDISGNIEITVKSSDGLSADVRKNIYKQEAESGNTKSYLKMNN